MSRARPTTGVRKVQELEGGVIAWLYGLTDLDEVLVAIVQHVNPDDDSRRGWTEREFVPPDGVKHPRAPHGSPLGSPAWDAYFAASAAWRAAGDMRIVEDHPTRLPTAYYGGEPRVEVGWYRRTFCHCGEEHAFDIVPAEQGSRGASLAVLIDQEWY